MWKMVMPFSKRGKRFHQNFTKLRRLSPKKHRAGWNWHVQIWVYSEGQTHLDAGSWVWREWCVSIKPITCTVLTNVKWETNRNICPFCQIYQWWLIFIWKNDSSQIHWFLPFLSIWKWLPFCCFSYQLLLWFKILNHILLLRNVKSGLFSC